MTDSETPAASGSKGWHTFGNLAVNLENYSVYIDDTLVELSAREFDLLQIMMTNVGQILPYSTFAEALWNSSEKRQLRSLTVHVHRLRRKLARSSPFVIKTVRSRGYGLIELRPSFLASEALMVS